MPSKTRIVLLGATGSIGDSALQVVRAHPDRLELVGVAAHSNASKLAAIVREFDIPEAALFDEAACRAARKAGAFPAANRLRPGLEGLEALAALPDADLVLVAVVGTQGLFPALAAIEADKTLAIASKEILVLAGKFIVEAAKRRNVRLLPVDSEHNAIFQCLDNGGARHACKLILTASGGSFRDTPIERLADVSLEQALRHPNWDMGPKVTIDSATMANKGLEMIEARWLFGMRPDQIETVIHPQSLAHSLVEFVDGSVLAQLSPPHMAFAIQHCLLYPDRQPGVVPTLDFSQALSLDFRPPDLRRYPCLRLAREALEAGGAAPGVYNAANEVAVEAFVQGRIRFLDIPAVIEKTLEKADNAEPGSVDEVLNYDRQARQTATKAVRAAPTPSRQP